MIRTNRISDGRYLVGFDRTGPRDVVTVGTVERFRIRTPVLTTDGGRTYEIGATYRTAWRFGVGSEPTRTGDYRTRRDAISALFAERERRDVVPGSPAAFGWTVVAGTDDAPRIVRGSDGVTRYRDSADADRAARETADRLRGRRVRSRRTGLEIGTVRGASTGGIGLSGLDGMYWSVTLSVESRSGTSFVPAETVETV